ncbi:MAG: oligosaccharide flippase family protein [Bacilli bacterium]|nr:oligosaccharide flippase family protein [Bacilli bacterium]
MNQKKELIKNTIIISIGKFSTQLISFLLLPLYTSLLKTSEYGEYDFLNTISIFLIPCVTLLMEEGMFRFLIDAKTDKQKGEVFSATFIFSALSFLIWGILIFIVGNILHYAYTTYLIFYILASLLSALAGSTARGLSKFKLYSLFSFLSSLLTILLNILFILGLHMGLDSLFLSYIIGNSIVSIWLLLKINVFKYVRKENINKKITIDMIKYSFPLVPNSISWNAIGLTDRLLIVNILGSAKNGVYSVGLRFPTIINTCYSYFNLSWKESASKVVNKEDKNEFYNSVYINLNRFLICVSILVIAFLPFIFNFLIKKDYQEAYIYIPLMIISVYFSNLSNFCSGIFSAYKDTKILAQTTIIATIINFVVGFLLIRKIGLFASIFATMIAYIVIYFYRNYKLKKYIVLQHDKYVFSHIIILLLVTFSYYLKNTWILLFSLIVAIIYSYYVNSELIKPILNKLKKRK